MHLETQLEYAKSQSNAFWENNFALKQAILQLGSNFSNILESIEMYTNLSEKLWFLHFNDNLSFKRLYFIKQHLILYDFIGKTN